MNKEKDDVPARLYVAFEYDANKIGFMDKLKYEAVRLYYGDYPPLCAICYVWGNSVPVGTTVSSPYWERTKIIVIESGTSLLNRWVQEKRNVYEDFKNVFAENPPMISAVTIMTDTDNTGETAVTYYGDILFTKK